MAILKESETVTETRKRYWQLNANIRHTVLLVTFLMSRHFPVMWSGLFLLFAPLVFTTIYTYRSKNQFGGRKDQFAYIFYTTVMTWLIGAFYLILIFQIRKGVFTPGEIDPSREIAPQLRGYLFQ